MTVKTINAQILSFMESLEKAERLNVLNFIKKLVQRSQKGKPENEQLLALAGTISKNDLKTMEKATKEGCEKIDEHEW